ncbi:MAG: hypothetical protein PHV37_07885 [Candidatus Gastranaerophilales bacterium]|nr:hypothetical protein [Candidatus Gastranaerophilales bacterium]
MKKFICLFLCFFYFASSNICFADSTHLYFVKNTNKSLLKPYVEQSYLKEKYDLTKTDPYYGVLKTDNSNSALIILQTTGSNVFYFYKSTSNNRLDKAILKMLKTNNIVYEESFNTNYINLFETQSNKILSNNGTDLYSFDSTTTKYQAPAKKSQTSQSTALKGYIGKVVSGTTFKTYLQTPINTSTASKGDVVTAVLSEDWSYNGNIIAPQGSLVSGILTNARHASVGSFNGKAIIDFNKITTPDNKIYYISTEPIDFSVTNEGKIAKSTKSVITAAAVGAVVGLLAAACFSGSGSNLGKAAALGAASGAGISLVSSVAEKGVDAEIPVYTDLELKLIKPLNVMLKY